MKYRKHRERIAEKKHRKNSRRRKKILKQRSRIAKIKVINKNVTKIGSTPFKRHVVVIPVVFCLEQNLSETLAFFADIKNFDYKKFTDICFDFSSVAKLTQGAMMILLSICGWLADQQLRVFTNAPFTDSSKQFFKESGFLDYFRVNYRQNNSFGDNIILHKGAEKTESSQTAEQIKRAMNTVWGSKYRNPKLQGMLIELMANTVNHAYSKNQKGWYFAVHHFPKERKVKFCFVDNGKGIIRSLRNKLSFQVLSFSDSNTSAVALLKGAFAGTARSSTQLSFRGRGLPLIKKVFDDGVIKNLQVVTNNIMINFAKNTTSVLPKGFDGTYYFWEIDENCTKWIFQ